MHLFWWSLWKRNASAAAWIIQTGRKYVFGRQQFSDQWRLRSVPGAPDPSVWAPVKVSERSDWLKKDVIKQIRWLIKDINFAMKKINQEISKKCLTRDSCGGRLVFVADAAPTKTKQPESWSGAGFRTIGPEDAPWKINSNATLKNSRSSRKTVRIIQNKKQLICILSRAHMSKEVN